MFEAKDPAALRQRATRCRQIVRGINDGPAERALLRLAEEYERKARRLELEMVHLVPLTPSHP